MKYIQKSIICCTAFFCSIASAASFDGIQVGRTTYQGAESVIKRINDSYGGQGLIPIKGTAARASFAIGTASAKHSLGQLGANMVVAAGNNNVITYVRYSIPKANLQSAIDVINKSYKGIYMERSGSEETGPTDWFFVGALDVTWVRGAGQDRVEIIYATHELLQEILTKDTPNQEWAADVLKLRAKAM